MTNTVRCTLLLVATALALPACLGDTPDTLSTTGVADPQPWKPGKPIPSTLHDTLLDIFTHSAGTDATPARAHRGAGTWAETVDAPELCAQCAITLVHLETNDARSLEVLDDHGEPLCAITATETLAILTDSCGARAD